MSDSKSSFAGAIEEDDPLQAALLEAETLMESLGGGGASFAIDSDDEEEEAPPVPNLHPLHEEFLKQPPANSSSSHQTSNGIPSGASGGMYPGLTPAAVPPVSGLYAAPSTPVAAPPFGGSGDMSLGLQNFSVAAAGPSLDVLKASTSRFASNLANMAQRAANQVSTAVGSPTAQPGSGGGFLPMNPHAVAPTNYAAMTPAVATPLPELDAEQKLVLVQSHVGDLIPGERIIMFLQNVWHVSDSTGFQYSHQQSPTVTWCCAVTFYRLLLFRTHPLPAPEKPDHWNAACWPPPPPSVLQMPLANVDKVEKSVFTATTAVTGLCSLQVGAAASNLTSSNTLSTTTILGLILHDKLHGRQIRFTTSSYPDTNRAFEALQTYCFPGRRNLGYLFAFESKRELVMASVETDPTTGNKKVTLPPVRPRFDARQEFQRQFANAPSPTPPWTIWTTTNASYQLCMTYPSILVGPVSLDETLHPDTAGRILRQCAAFRSEQRLPALTWCGAGGRSIWRCSQPKIGLQGHRSAGDELVLQHILDCAAAARAAVPVVPPRSVLVPLTGSPDLSNWLPHAVGLKILDLRPRSSAMANRTGGYGYENTSNYPGCSLQFCNIGNIHAVRDAYQKLSQLCLSTMASDLQFAGQVEDTKWLSHLRIIWAAAWETAYWVHVHQLPVLLHCSHGWDRTSQVACLAQLLLDPYYRTLDGFACLVEKDFMSFGHPFHTRCGHGEGRDGASNATANGGGVASIDEGQISPIFLQFLDCVYQVVRLYPEAFEFNTKYLLLLSEHIYSCRFGNFLCDSEREREAVAGIRQRTHSIWDYIEEHRADVRNPQFQEEGDGGVLLMPLPTLLRNIVLWTDRHCMNSPKPCLRWLPAGVERTIHPRNHDQSSDLWTEQELQQLLRALPLPPEVSPVAESIEDDKETTPAVAVPSSEDEVPIS
jgi:myotubularin-related protein 1/2